MKRLHHGPLLFWMIATLFLATVLVSAAVLGREDSSVSQESVAATSVDDFRAELVILPSLLSTPRSVSSWANALAVRAQDSAKTAATKSLELAWTEAAESARALAAADPSDKDSYAAAVLALSTTGDRLALADSGVELSPRLDPPARLGSDAQLPAPN